MQTVLCWIAHIRQNAADSHRTLQIRTGGHSPIGPF